MKMLNTELLLECDYCGHRSSTSSPSCDKCSRDYTFLSTSPSSWTSDECYRWLYSQHFQLYERVESTGDFSRLSEGEQLNYLIGYLCFQVQNGGLWQYFLNPCGCDAPECVTALQRIGAQKWANLLKSYIGSFPIKRPPTSMEERENLLSQIPAWRMFFRNRRESLLVEGLEKPREDIPLLLALFLSKQP